MSNFSRACNASPANRILRFFIALFVGAFALASLDTPLVAVVGGIAALYVLFLAITGWCPGSMVDPHSIDLTADDDSQR